MSFLPSPARRQRGIILGKLPACERRLLRNALRRDVPAPHPNAPARRGRGPAAPPDPSDTAVPHARWARLKRLLIDLSVEAICASIRYIPLWAVEIAALPEPEAGTAKQDDSSNASTFGGRTGK